MIRIALTLGDPRGIGPEVVVRAAREHTTEDAGTRLVLFGPEEVDAGDLEYRSVGPWKGDEASAGAVAARAIRAAVELCLTGGADALVTGPINKPALRLAGEGVPGHTELLRDLTGVEHVGMLMAAERNRLGGPLRILLATTHLALRDVPARLTPDLLFAQTSLLHRALSLDWRIPSPRIGLCALNPHAGDGGLFGDEETRVYAPALERLVGEGVDARGPLSADTVFRRALAGELDAVVAPYHDVGMAAFKTVSFGAGVNVTLGLPFARTSPDHGTAFDIAGTGTADPSSTLEALRLAVRLAKGRRARTDREGSA